MTYLPRTGREYFHWTFTGLPTGAQVEASIDGVWHPLEMDGSDGRLLLAGPDAEQGDAVKVPTNQVIPLRVTDNPEIIVRSGGSVTLLPQ